MKRLLAIGFVLIPLLSLSQAVFKATVGDTTCNEEAYTAIAVQEKTLVSAAVNCQGGSTNWESWLLLLDENGDTLWTRQNEIANGFIRPISDGNLMFLGGETAGFVHDTIYLTKTDNLGKQLWTATLFIATCRSTAYDLIETSDGGFAITGIYSIDPCSNPSFNGFLWKVDSLGSTQWAQFYRGSGEDQLFSVKGTSDGFYLFGFSNSGSANNRDYWLIKTDLNGDTLWTKLYGDADNDFGYDMELLDDGLILFGYDDSASVIKTDLQGNTQWEKNLGDACGGSYFKVNETLDKQLAFLMYGNDNGQCSSTLIKMDPDGNEYWRKNWGGLFREFTETSPGTFVLAGNLGFPPDAYIVRFDTTYIDSLIETSVAGFLLAGVVSIYPNPASEYIHVKVNNIHSGITASLYNLNGQLLDEQWHTTGTFTLERKNYPAGIYLLQLTTTKGTSITRKVIWE